jgi:hypothetical protein
VPKKTSGCEERREDKLDFVAPHREVALARRAAMDPEQMARIAKAESREVSTHCPASARDGAIACLPALRPSAAHHQAHLHTLNSLNSLPQLPPTRYRNYRKRPSL